jgi:hypothetical protein
MREFLLTVVLAWAIVALPYQKRTPAPLFCGYFYAPAPAPRDGGSQIKIWPQLSGTREGRALLLGVVTVAAFLCRNTKPKGGVL